MCHFWSPFKILVYLTEFSVELETDGLILMIRDVLNQFYVKFLKDGGT